MRRTDQRRAAVFAGYQHDVTGTPVEQLVERESLTDFARELVLGVEQHREELDGLISDQAVDWSVDRIAPLERAILRVALYEILHRPDVPDEVAIDEAVETAKVFSGSEAPGFVNGILGGVMRRLATQQQRMSEHEQTQQRLSDLSRRLEESAGRLGADDLDPDEATRLAGECAELASQAAVELDRLTRLAPGDPVPGQEELL